MTGWNDRDVEQLTVMRHTIAMQEALLRSTVSHLRQQECPWSVIGAALGVSKQAAAKKYGSKRVSHKDRPLTTPEP